MLEQGRISESQLVAMLMYTVLGTAYFFLAAVAPAFAGHDAWLAPLIAMVPGFLVAGISGCLTARFPGFNFFDWTEIVLGRTGGKIMEFFYILFFIHVTIIIINEFTSFLNVAFAPLTPPLVFSIMVLFLTGVAVYGGIEIIARLAIIFLPISIVMSVGMLIMASGLYNAGNLAPFLAKGMKHVLAGSVSPSGLQCEIFLGAMLFPCLKRPAQGGWVQLRANLWIGLLLLLVSFSVVLAYGDEAGRLSLPVFSLAREINLLHFFQHLESLVLVLWFSGIFMKVAIWEYVTVLGTAQWLNTDSYRPLVLPMGLLLAALTNYDVPNVAFLSHFTATVIPFEVMLFGLVLPGLVLLLTVMRQKKSSGLSV